MADLFTELANYASNKQVVCHLEGLFSTLYLHLPIARHSNTGEKIFTLGNAAQAVCLLYGGCLIPPTLECSFVLGCEVYCLGCDHRIIKKGFNISLLYFLFKCKKNKV